MLRNVIDVVGAFHQAHATERVLVAEVSFQQRMLQGQRMAVWYQTRYMQVGEAHGIIGLLIILTLVARLDDHGRGIDEESVAVGDSTEQPPTDVRARSCAFEL